MNFCKHSDRTGKAHTLQWLTGGHLPNAFGGELLRMVHVFIYIVDQPHCTAVPEDFAHIRRVVVGEHQILSSIRLAKDLIVVLEVLLGEMEG